MKVQGFVIEFIISAVLVLVVFGAAADEEASFAYHSCFIIFAHNLDGKLSLPDSVPNVHSCFTKMVWWRYLKQLSTCFNCHRHPHPDAYTPHRPARVYLVLRHLQSDLPSLPAIFLL